MSLAVEGFLKDVILDRVPALELHESRLSEHLRTMIPGTAIQPQAEDHTEADLLLQPQHTRIMVVPCFPVPTPLNNIIEARSWWVALNFSFRSKAKSCC